MCGVGASMPAKKKTIFLGIWGVEGGKCWDAFDVRGAKECQEGMGVCGEGMEMMGRKSMHGALWDMGGVGFGSEMCHDGLTKERTLGYRAWGSTLGIKGVDLGGHFALGNVAFEISLDICTRSKYSRVSRYFVVLMMEFSAVLA